MKLKGMYNGMKIYGWDPAEELETEEERLEYLKLASQDNDAELMAVAQDDVERSRVIFEQKEN